MIVVLLASIGNKLSPLGLGHINSLLERRVVVVVVVVISPTGSLTDQSKTPKHKLLKRIGI